MSTLPLFNPWASIPQLGLTVEDECDPVDFTAVFPGTRSALTLTGFAGPGPGPIQTFKFYVSDVPFDFHGIWIFTDHATQGFLLRFTNEIGIFTQNFGAWSRNIPGLHSEPMPIFPKIPFPAGYTMTIQLQTLATADQLVQIGLRGVKKYRKS